VRVCIHHLRHARSGGTERYLDYLAADLAGRGHEVTILCRSHAEAPHPAVRFVRLGGWALGRGHRLWRFARAVEDHLAAQPYDVVLGLGRTWSQDVIRLGGGTWALYLERAMPADRPAWQRWLGRDALADRICLGIERRALAPGGTPFVIANSRMIAGEIQRRYGCEPERIRVVHNAVDTARFDPALRDGPGAALRRSWGFAADDTVLLFLGSNYARKGLDRVLAGLAEVAPAFPRARLAVAGFDGDIDGWRRRAAAAGLADRVVFAGGRRDVEACYAAADVYLLPTLYDPFANTTVEALACGLPVVTTDGNGGCEVLDDACGTVLPWTCDGHAIAGALRRWCAPGAAAAARDAARAAALANRVELGMARSRAVLDEAAAARAARLAGARVP
jgi:UDP-glucose:(heptosyl)LPS alpha-1,3-glucosyltransferase